MVEPGEPLPDDLSWLRAMPNDLVVDSSLIRDTLGWREFTRPHERVENHVAWLRKSRAAG